MAVNPYTLVDDSDRVGTIDTSLNCSALLKVKQAIAIYKSSSIVTMSL